MTEAEQFALIDSYRGNTMIVFSDKAVAMRYVLSRYTRHGPESGLIAACEDTREGTGLYVMWRDPIGGDELEKRIANCRWLLEMTLAGGYPRPEAGEVGELWTGGRPKAH
jgi:hypothetical protein